MSEPSSAEQYAATIRRELGIAIEALRESKGKRDHKAVRPDTARTALAKIERPLAALLEQQQRDERIKELEATAEAVARSGDGSERIVAIWRRLNLLCENEFDAALAVGGEAFDWTDAYADDVRFLLVDRQMAERLLDEARLALAAICENGTGYRGVWWDVKRCAEVAADALARLGAAAPQQEPATSGDERWGARQSGGEGVMQPYDWCNPRCPNPCWCQDTIDEKLREAEQCGTTDDAQASSPSSSPSGGVSGVNET